MRIAVVSTSFPLDEASVSGVFVRRMVESLPAGFDPLVVTSAADHSLPPPSSARYRLRCFRYGPWAWQRLAHRPGGIPAALAGSRWMWGVLPLYLAALFFASLRVARRVELIHANWAVTGALAGLAGRLARRPVVTTLRGSDVARAGRGAVDRLLLRMALRFSDRVVTVSESLREELMRLFPVDPAKVTVISNGVEASLLSLDAGSGEEGLAVVTVCNLIPAKGVATIIEALDACEGVTLHVVGDGPQREALAALAARLGVAERVRFHGKVAPARVADRLARADAFVLASESEGRPNAVLEALAAGVPVVATDIDAVREIVGDGDNGLLFAPGDAAALAERLNRLRDAGLRRRLSRAGRAFIVDQGLLWEQTGRRYAELYQALRGAGA